MNECSAYVGLDVHKDTIAVALPGRFSFSATIESTSHTARLRVLMTARHPYRIANSPPMTVIARRPQTGFSETPLAPVLQSPE